MKSPPIKSGQGDEKGKLFLLKFLNILGKKTENFCNLGRQAENIMFKSCAKNSHNCFPSKSANVRQCPLMSQKTRPLSHRIQKGQGIDGRDIGGHVTPRPH